MNYIGVDVSKDSFNYCCIDEKLNEVGSGSFKMDLEGFNEFKNIVKKFDESVIALESTGSYHTNILSFIVSFKKEVCLINPQLIKKFSQGVTLRKTKTDEIDAKVIACFIAKNIEHFSYFNPDNIDEIRVIARLREDISKQVAAAKTRLKQHLSVVFPELLVNYDVFTTLILNLLMHFPTPESIRNADLKEIKSVIGVNGKKSSDKIKEIKELAKDSVGKNSRNFETVIKFDVSALEFLNGKLKEITDTFIEEVKKSNKDDIGFISSIKGISDITACHFITEVKDIKRFSTRNKLIAFAGTDPSVKQSGTSIHSNGRISKKGSRTLRRYLYLMAQSLVIHNEHFREYYDKKKKEGMPHRKAMIALCNKLLRILYALLTKRQNYDGSLNKAYA